MGKHYSDKFLVTCLYLIVFGVILLGTSSTYASGLDAFGYSFEDFLLVSILWGSGLVALVCVLYAKRKPKVKRRAFSKETKEKVLRSQNYLCNDCGKSAQNWDFDHIGSRGDSSAHNCQALCLDCHRDKTTREARQRKK